MNKAQLSLLLQVLEHIRDNRESLPRWCGICGCVLAVLPLKNHYETWDWLEAQFTLLGLDKRYPVGGYAEYKNSYRNQNMWDNPKRVKLLHTLIARAKQQLKEANNV